MDEKVRALLDRVRETAVAVGEAAGSTARYAGKYAGQMVDAAKLNMQIFDLRSEVNERLRAIGLVVYNTHLGRDAGEDKITGLLEEIDKKNLAVEELKGRIAALKNCKDCPGCGSSCAQEDRFCKRCGVSFS